MSTARRFLVFAGRDLYPDGGLDDVRLDTDDEAEARRHLAHVLVSDDYGLDWGHVYDQEQRRVIARGVRGLGVIDVSNVEAVADGAGADLPRRR